MEQPSIPGSAENSHPHLRELAGAAAVLGALSLVAYAPFLRMFFIYDDLPALRRSSPALGNGLREVFLPMPNGFWRPLNTLLAMLTEAVFGRVPQAFHGVQLVLHATNAVLLWWFARRILRAGVGASLAAAALFAVNVGGYLAVVQMGNSADVTLAMGILLFLAGLALVGEGYRGGPAVLTGGLVLGFLSKETFVVAPGVALLLALSERDGAIAAALRRRSIQVLLVLLFVAYLAAIAFAQRHAASYAADGILAPAPVAIIRRFADYSLSLAVPYFHVLELPFRPLRLPNAALWGLRALTLGAIALVAYQVVARARPARPAALFLGAVLIAAPASLLAFPTESRFLYPALPLACLALVQLGATMPYRRTVLGAAMVAHVLGLYASGTAVGLRDCAARVAALTESARRESTSWEAGDGIVILGQPLVSTGASTWVYRQLLFDIFLGPDRFRYLPDEQQATADHAYRFDGTALIPLPRRAGS